MFGNLNYDKMKFSGSQIKQFVGLDRIYLVEPSL